MSHNLYNVDSKPKLTKLPNYLIKIEKHDTCLGKTMETIIPCTCLTTALRIVREEKCICTIYETITNKGLRAEYLCDASYGVC